MSPVNLSLKIFNMNVASWRSLAESPLSAVEREEAVAAVAVGWLVSGTFDEVG